MSDGADTRTRDGERRVTITAASRTDDVTTVALALERGPWPSEPVAPASVWNDQGDRVVELHKLIRLERASAVFESYDLESVPQPGGPYRMFSWWTPEQYEAATDTSIEWRRATYDTPDDHEHCVLTWATIATGDTGYQASSGSCWITVDAYEKYIRDDLLRLRNH
jgi:hypothetical protein